jgi:hypothetical protein
MDANHQPNETDPVRNLVRNAADAAHHVPIPDLNGAPIYRTNPGHRPRLARIAVALSVVVALIGTGGFLARRQSRSAIGYLGR